MPEPYQGQLHDKDAIQALYPNILLRGPSSNVRYGCAVTAGGGMSVDVDSGAVNVRARQHDISQVTLDHPASSSDPRIDVVYVGYAGNPSVQVGTAEPAQSPSTIQPTGLQAQRPAPPDLSDISGTILAAVWIPANATEITDGNIYDLRYRSQFAANRLLAGAVEANRLEGEITNGNSVTQLPGQGLRIDNGSLGVTDEILSDSGSGGGGTGSGDGRGTLEVVDVVAEYGADPTGTEDVGEIIHDNQAPGRILFFPEGTYRLEHGVVIDDSACVQTDADGHVAENRFGIVGPNAVWRPQQDRFTDPTGASNGWSILIKGRYNNTQTHFIFRGITWDMRGELRAHGLITNPYGSFDIRDVDVIGKWGREDIGSIVFGPSARNPEHESYINVRLPDGSVHQPTGDYPGPSQGGSEYNAQPIPIYFGRQWNENCTVTVKDCVAVGYPNNGIYASICPASVRVIGGFWKDNDHGQIRLGGNRHRVEDARVITSSATSDGHATGHGIWLREGSDSDQYGSQEETTATVENCHITIEEVPDQNPNAIRVDGTMGAATITDCTLVSHNGGNGGWAAPTVNVQPYYGAVDDPDDGDPMPEYQTQIVMKNCYVYRDSQGDGSNCAMVQRVDTRFEDCTFRAANSADNGITFHPDAGQNVVDNCDFPGAGSDITWNAADGRIEWLETGSNQPTITGDQHRLVVNGESFNEGQDPRSGGPWNGNGRRGVVVTWNSGGTQYYARHTNGTWHAWGATA